MGMNQIQNYGKFNPLNILYLVLLVGLFISYLRIPDRPIEEEFVIPEIDTLHLQQPKFFTSDNPERDLMEALIFFDVKHKDIVMAQAILETGNFKSRVCKEYNNLFGLYDSSKKDYYKFYHWSESVFAYLKYIQYRYKPPDDYYQFLIDLGYAEDPLYIYKLKNINKKRDGKS